MGKDLLGSISNISPYSSPINIFLIRRILLLVLRLGSVFISIASLYRKRIDSKGKRCIVSRTLLSCLPIRQDEAPILSTKIELISEQIREMDRGGLHLSLQRS